MIFQALAKLALTAVRPPKEGERVGAEGHRRQHSGDKSAKRAHEDETRGPHPVLNTHGETTGKVIDTEA